MAEYELNKIVDYFAPGGPVSIAVPGFTYRQEQVNLAQGVTNSLSRNEFLVAEVGTGVGKTLAYLLPAFLWTLTQKDKILIATRTKALQQQLVERDIPNLLKATGIELDFMEAKGRENYLCWRKYINILAGKQKLSEDQQRFIIKILSWAETTKTGDRKELNLAASLMQHWPLLAADRRSCQKDLCTYHDKCLRLKMMKKLHKADLIVVNHALLLADIQVQNSILPEYKYLIIDEAHNFERESFDKLSCNFSYLENGDLLKALHWEDKKYSRGYLAHLKSKFPHLVDKLKEASTVINRSTELLDAMFSALTAAGSKGSNYSLVLEEHHFEQEFLSDFIDEYLDWRANSLILFDQLNDLKSELAGQEEEGELSLFIGTLQENIDQAYTIIEENFNRQDSINWIEFRDGHPIGLQSSFVMIGEILRERLYDRLDSMIMVSATLTIEDKFDYYLEKTGLNSFLQEGRLQTLLQKSPFNYEKQARIFTVSDMPQPNYAEHSQETARALLDVIQATGGGILVLFTARKQLQEVAAIVKPACKSQGINLLIQEESGAPGLLLKDFTDHKNSVLMGLETFWEGIDVKGEALRCVVIVKLPFRSPSDPFCIAGDRFCLFNRRNGFQHFMLPDSAMRFKQGTGRLIRSEADRGVVVVLDRRLEKSNYGQVFKNSIPISQGKSLKKKDLLPEIQAFMHDTR